MPLLPKVSEPFTGAGWAEPGQAAGWENSQKSKNPRLHGNVLALLSPRHRQALVRAAIGSLVHRLRQRLARWILTIILHDSTLTPFPPIADGRALPFTKYTPELAMDGHAAAWYAQLSAMLIPTDEECRLQLKRIMMCLTTNRL
jgi:hypothetical protein